MKEITLKDCYELKLKFDKYCETAEQHQFVMLAKINMMMDATFEEIDKKGFESIERKELYAMFRVVLRTIGEDYSEYVEVSDGTDI